MEQEIESRDVILLIQQFLAENGLESSLAALQKETGIHHALVLPHAQRDTLQSVLNGHWHKVLDSIGRYQLEPAQMVPLYNQLIRELVEMGEFGAARTLLRQSGTGQYMRDYQTDLYLRLEEICSSSTIPDHSVLFGGKERQKCREELAEVLAKHLKVAEPSRLLALLSQSLRYQFEHGLLPSGHKLDLFRNVVWKSSEDAIPTREYAKIKFGQKGAAMCAVFSPDGSYFVTGSRDGFIEVYDYKTGKLRLDLEYQAREQIMMMTGTITCLEVSDNSEYLVSGCGNGEVMVWSLRTGKCLKSFRVHKESVTCLRFSKDASLIYSASNDSTIKVFGMKSGKCLREFRGHKSFVTDFQLFDDERKLASVSADGTLKLWDTKTAFCKQTVTMNAGSDTDTIGDTQAILKLISFGNDLVALRRDLIFVFSDKLQLKRKIENPFNRTDSSHDDLVSLVKSPNERFIHCVTFSGSIATFLNWEVVEKFSIFGTAEQQSHLQKQSAEVVGFVQCPSDDIFAVFCDDGLLKFFK